MVENTDFEKAVKEEVNELLIQFEDSLLELEKAPENLEIVASIFRDVHTIKGSCAMCGLDDIAGFTHHVETVLDKVRKGELPVSNRLITLNLSAQDYIKKLLDNGVGVADFDKGQGEKIISELRLLSADDNKTKNSGSACASKHSLEENDSKELQAERVIYYIHFEPSDEFSKGNNNVNSILEEVKKCGQITIVCDGSISTGENALPDDSTSPFYDIILTTALSENEIRDIFIFAENSCKVSLSRISDEHCEDLPKHKLLGEILLERGTISAEDLENALKKQPKLGELLVDEKLVSKGDVQSALTQQRFIKEKRDCCEKKNIQAPESIRVPSLKLDSLVNLVGEFVVIQSRLSELALKSDDREMHLAVKVVERLTAEMRDEVLNIRMLPIGSTFSRFKRLVRDLSEDLGKDVEMVTEGAETEIDKSIIDQLGDPLIHLIRNCMDHGFETPEERMALGKNRKGRIKLSACHSGSSVVVTVSDDGKGLDTDKIKSKALKNGIIPPNAKLTEEEIFNLIFEGGFSTAEKVTSVSGRGVGMDVVKSTVVGKLKGSVSVSSRQGEGTAVAISLPLTLAIIDGLLVKAGNTHFVLPLLNVEKCVELKQEDINRFHGRKIFDVQGEVIPYIRLREFYFIPGEKLVKEQLVILNINEKRVGLVLDEVIGGHQTVIKSLGWAYRNAEGVSGATILGNGEVALIVDVGMVMKCANHEEQRLTVLRGE